MDYEVIVVGGGPVGMLLAAELALAGVKVVVLERLAAASPYSRALTLHPRSLELLDMRGLKETLLQAGKPIASGHFAALDARLDFSVFDSSSNYTLFIPQTATEQALQNHAAGWGADIRRGVEVVGVRQEEHVVEVACTSAGQAFVLRAAYVVGADGAGSIVRKEAGIRFEGTDETITAMLGDAVLPELPEGGVVSRCSEQGLAMIVPMAGRLHRVVMVDPQRTRAPKREPVTLEELRSGMIRILGSDYGLKEPFWLSRFGNAARQSACYRKGRIFLAGDAAHIHFPAGGQGLNVGLQEAMNLGWKLAAELQGRAPSGLLDSYHSERFPVNTALLRNTSVQTMLMSDFTPQMAGLRSLLNELLQEPGANCRLARQIAGFNIRYEAEPSRPDGDWNGCRLPELRLRLSNGKLCSIYELFREGRFLLLQLADDERLSEFGGSRRHVQTVRADLAEPAQGWDDMHAALVRPDGYVAWTVSRSEPSPGDAMRQEMSRWCGE